MLVYVPHPNNPLFGTWMDLPYQQRVNPSTVRAIWKARTQAKHLEGGLPLAQAQDDAAYETARMLGLTQRTVRVFCKLPVEPRKPPEPRPWKVQSRMARKVQRSKPRNRFQRVVQPVDGAQLPSTPERVVGQPAARDAAIGGTAH